MEKRASRIVQYLAESLNTPYHGTSSMTPAVYDTAWVSLVSKPSTAQNAEEQRRWLFPECFQAILDSQAPSGGFVDDGAQVDGILSTMAALLALCKRRDTTITGCSIPSDLEQRIERAAAFIDQALKQWDVQSTVHVGFEILVPSMLHLLQDEGFTFEYPGRDALMAMNKHKMDKIKLPILYTKHKTTLLHSLEAFVGKVDFSKTAHFLHDGHMMGSPSSTAAYLMNAAEWDDAAEQYLRFVVDAGYGRVPSAFPLCMFEISWVLSTFMESGFTADMLGRPAVTKLAEFLETQLNVQSGVTGPGALADADDTAKSIHSLHLLGRSAPCEPMIAAFETPKHFKTYNLESSESFSANCNVLVALLGSPEPARHVSQINKSLTFLCKTWYEGRSADKWNVEAQYSLMLLSEALSRVLRLWNDGTLTDLPSVLLTECIPLTTTQILVRTLSTISDNGSWKDCAETTAYAVLTLKKLANLPWTAGILGPKIQEAIELGINYLNANEDQWTKPAMIWVEKVTYGSNVLAETYCVAAIQPQPCTTVWGDKVTNTCQVPSKKIEKFAQFLGALPLFKDEPDWRLRSSIVEGSMLMPELVRSQKELNIFPQQKQSGGSKYLDYIPLAWTACNNAAGFGISTRTMIDMIVVSLLNFQVDKFCEEVTEGFRLDEEFERLKAVIREVFDEDRGSDELRSNGHSNGANGHSTAHGYGDTNGHAHVDGATNGNTNGNGVANGHAPANGNGYINGHGGPVQRNGTVNDDGHAVNGHDEEHQNGNGVTNGNGYTSGHGGPVNNGKLHNTTNDNGKRSQEEVRSEVLSDAKEVLSNFREYVMEKIAGASPPERRRVSQELLVFVEAHVTHGQDCKRLPKPEWPGQSTVFTPAKGTYYDWVRTTSADHTSCPYSFEFFRCLIAAAHKETGHITGARGQYIAQDVCRHLATMCRQYNDYGSIRRDRAENNLNSVNFPEFSADGEKDETKLRETLLDIANYEREGLNLALSKLRPEITAPVWNAMRVFIDVTDLFGQIYVVRDINT